MEKFLDGICSGDDLGIDYLLLPVTRLHQNPSIDWECVTSALFSCKEYAKDHVECPQPNSCAGVLHTENGRVCTCMVQHSVVYTPHNGILYCITGLLDELNGNSPLRRRDGTVLTYKKYYEIRYVLLSCTSLFAFEILSKKKRIRCMQSEKNIELLGCFILYPSHL